jgi:hypothetical protein
MACYMIGYDVKTPGQDDAALVEAIGEIATQSFPCLHSTWLVLTEKSAVELRDALTHHLGSNDRLFVAEVGRDAAWRGAGKNFTDSLNRLLTRFEPRANGSL